MKSNKVKLKTMIGENTEVVGDLKTEGGILVNGKIKGNIKTNGFISIGEKGFVSGTIECSECIISGKIEGNVTASKSIEIHIKSVVNGDIVSPKLKIDEGAILNGNCLMNKNIENKREKK